MAGHAVGLNDVAGLKIDREGGFLALHIADEVAYAFLGLERDLAQQVRRSMTFVAGQIGMGRLAVCEGGLVHDMARRTERTRISELHSGRRREYQRRSQRGSCGQHLQGTSFCHRLLLGFRNG